MARIDKRSRAGATFGAWE